MMKKILIPLLLTVLTTISAYEGTLAVRGASFFPLEHRFQQVYGNATWDVQVEAGMALNSGWEVFTNIDYMAIDRNKNSCCKTYAEVVQGSFGLKRSFRLSDQNDFYLGVGPSFGHISLDNHSCCGKEVKSKYATGVVVKSGVRHFFYNGFFLDLFVDYLYQPVHFHKRVDIGGIKTGAGLGLAF